ncbi:MAG: DUF63 family protein [bacterium]
MDESDATQPSAGTAPPPAEPAVAPQPPAPAPEPRPSRFSGIVERLPVWLVPLILIGVPVMAWIASQAWPEAFGRQVIWQYYWGPIHADAAGHSAECLMPDGSIVAAACSGQGVTTHSGYTIVNTLTWAALLGLCILGTAQMLARKKTVMGPKLIMGAVGWVVAGSVFHVLEDVNLFGQPTQYFFITPPIYLLFAAMGVATFVIGHYLKGIAEKAGLERALAKLWFVVALPVVCYLLLYLPPTWNQVHSYVNPIWVALFGLIAYAIAAWRFRRIGRIDPSELVGFMSIGWILLSVAYIAQFMRAPWLPYLATGQSCPLIFPDRCLSTHPVILALWAPFAAAAVAIVIAWAARAWSARDKAAGRDPKWAAFASPINMLLVFSQMLDGFATSIGIDIGRVYDEKHVLSGKIIEWTRDAGTQTGFAPMHDYPTFFGFLPVKLVVSLLVVYAIDVSNPKDAQRYPTMIGLVKFAIIMVGLGPGIRDFVRMSLGV